MPKKVAKIDLVFSIDGIGAVIAMPLEESGKSMHKRKFNVVSVF